MTTTTDFKNLSAAEWKKRLTPAQYGILREEGTERAFTSPLDHEKRKGTFACAGCDLPLFSSDTKFDIAVGLSHEEAAAALGMPLGTVKSHIARGREKLKTLLQDHAP